MVLTLLLVLNELLCLLKIIESEVVLIHFHVHAPDIIQAEYFIDLALFFRFLNALNFVLAKRREDL